MSGTLRRELVSDPEGSLAVRERRCDSWFVCQPGGSAAPVESILRCRSDRYGQRPNAPSAHEYRRCQLDAGLSFNGVRQLNGEEGIDAVTGDWRVEIDLVDLSPRTSGDQ